MRALMIIGTLADAAAAVAAGAVGLGAAVEVSGVSLRILLITSSTVWGLAPDLGSSWAPATPMNRQATMAKAIFPNLRIEPDGPLPLNSEGWA